MNYFSHKRPEIFEYINVQPLKVLDIGCGEGVFGASLIHSYGSTMTVDGVEPNQEAAAIAKSKLTRVFSSTVEEAVGLLDSAAYDTAFFNDVLEHLYDPREVLKLIRPVLTPTARVYASIPNMLYYQTILNILRHKDFIYADFGVQDFTHIRWFTVKGMKRLFEEAGYIVIAQHGINKTQSRLGQLMQLMAFGRMEKICYPQILTVCTLSQ